MGFSEDEEEPGMAEQLKLLQQGREESDLKLKMMEENIAKILAAIQPPSQPSSPVIQPSSQLNPPVLQPTQSEQSTPVGSFSQTSSTASTVDNRSSTLANQSSLPQSVERQPPPGMPSCPAPWSTTRTTIPIPTMTEGMTFREYKNKVKLWSRNTDIPANRRAALLLMQLPTKDKHGGLYHIMYDRISLDQLEQEDGVNVLMDKLAEILDDPDFVRLANWWEKFSTFKQKPGMTTEKFFTEFHLLKNEAKNEFNFELPAQLLTATLMKACIDIPPDQIGIITANINLRHSDVDKSVENAIRQYMQSKQAYGSGKVSTKVFHCATQNRDVLGNVIDEDDDEEDDNKVLLNSKKRSREEHLKTKEIAKKRGLCTICFKKHAYRDCPKREETEQRVKKYKLSKGIPWKNDDGTWTLPDGKIVQELPNDHSVNLAVLDDDDLYDEQTLQPSHKPNRVLFTEEGTVKDVDGPSSTKDDSSGIPAVPVATSPCPVAISPCPVAISPCPVAISPFPPGCVSQSTGRPPIDPTMPDSDASFDGEGGTFDVNMSSRILLAYDNNLRAIMDTGCSRALAGSNWIKSFHSQISKEDLKQVQKFPSNAVFKFGDGHRHKSNTIWVFPVYFGGLRKRIAFDEVNAAIPLLISLDIVRRLGLETRHKHDMARVEDATPWFKLHLDKGHHWMSLLKQDSINDILPDQANMVMDDVDPSPVWLVEDEEVQVILTVKHTKKLLVNGVFDEGKMKSQLNNLHIQMAHAPMERFTSTLKIGKAWTPDMQEIVEEIYKDCSSVDCRARKSTQRVRKVAFRTAMNLGDIVAVDLKIRYQKKDILYIMDLATNFVLACLIDNKSPEEISKKIINLWLKAGFPRMKKIISDNGPEFTDGPMVTVLQMLNAKHQATAAYTPQQNGAIERVHCVCDENMKMLLQSIDIYDDEALDWAVHAYNAAIDRDGHSPMKLVFNVQTDISSLLDMTPAQLDDTEDRLPKTLRDKMRAREEAMANHVQLKMSRKIRQAILAKVRPTRGKKIIGRWFYWKRANEKDWWGPGQLVESLGSQATLRMGKHSYHARHDDLVELNRNELIEEVGDYEEINDQGMVDKSQQTEAAPKETEENVPEEDELVSEVEYFKHQHDKTQSESTASPPSPTIQTIRCLSPVMKFMRSMHPKSLTISITSHM